MKKMNSNFRRQGRWLASTALVAANVALVSLGWIGPAWAACSPAAATGVHAICTGTAFNQGNGAPGSGTNGYGTGVEKNLTVSIGTGARVIGTNDGIRANDNLTITEMSGTISGGANGINATDNFILSSSGSITGGALGNGILVKNSATIFNGGTITGATNNSISAGNNLILSNSGSGTITGKVGIITGDGANITNYGKIIGTGGTAINFAGAGGGNTLTLTPGSTITGLVLASTKGNDALQFGGTGAASFDISTVGNAAQYRGFGTFNKIGTSIWTLNGNNAAAMPWTVSGGVLIVNGTMANSTMTVNPAGTLQLGNGGTSGSISTNVLNNGTFAINRSDTYTFANVISGTGAFQQLGTGTTILTGANTYTGNTTISAGTLQLGDGGTSGSITSDVVNNSTFAINRSNAYTFANVISGSGAFQQLGTGTTILTGNNTYAGSTTINAGTLQLGNGGTSGSITSDVTNNGTFAINRSDNVTFANVISGTGAFQQLGTGITTLTNANTYTGATTISAGTLQLGNGGTSGSITSDVVDNGTFAINRSDNVTFANVISGTGAFQQLGAGTTMLTNANTYTGPTTVTAGTLAISATGSITSNVTNNATLNNAGTVTGSLINNGTSTNNGIWKGNVTSNTGTISNNLTWTGTVSNAGTFTNNAGGTVSGLLTSTAGVVTNNGLLGGDALINGGTLTGTGSVTNLTIANGSTFVPGDGTPGTFMTVTGNLAFQSGAQYLVSLNPTTSSYVLVNGTATLGGATVNASFAAGSYVSKQYTILQAGAVSGTFGTLVDTNLPSNFHATLSYDATHAYLNLLLNFSVPGGLNINQQNVANTLTDFFNTTGGIPMVFAALTPAQLTQADGEVATAAQQTTFSAMSQFTGMMTDRFVGERGDCIGDGYRAMPSTESNSACAGRETYARFSAEEGSTASAYAARRSVNNSDAYAMFNKVPPRVTPFNPSWSVWAGGFGGSQTTDGEGVVLGSTTATSRIAAGAVGADYRFSPNTLAGFALAGGGTNFVLANNLGSGRSDLFQAGAFIHHTAGASYFTGALAYGWQDVTTNRTVTIAGIDQLQARYDASAYSGRAESGYRFAGPVLGITPYAAAQFTVFDLPAYAERALVGSNTFALAYRAKSVTDARSEFGVRTDKSWALPNAILTLRGRLAWAHDYNPDRNIAATFQALPGTSFVVNGAAQASESALVTASAEIKWINGWSTAATFEGEFSNVTRSYAGKGSLRYAW